MNKLQAKRHIEKLKAEITQHNYNYHVLDKPTVSDAVYDSMFKELVKLEEQYPELITKDSPTQRVGGEPLKNFEKYQHSSRMLSLSDAFGISDLEKWIERISKIIPRNEIEKDGYYLELKMDGLAVALIYQNGIFSIGATRGNGTIGENVTSNLKTIKSIPLSLKKSTKDLLCSRGLESAQESIEIRGEVFLSKKDFEKLNSEREKQGLPTYANPRNISAGSIRQLDPQVTAKRDLDFLAYSIPNKVGLETHEQEHELADCLGFKTNKNNKHCKNIKEIEEYLKYWEKHRESLPYQTDGVVVSVNNKKAFEKLGVVGKSPRGAIAYKFAAEEAATKLEDITVQVGRTGRLTPVAHLKPVSVAGSTITRATLHNIDEINRKGIKISDTVIIRKAGDVIPEVVNPIEKLRNGTEKEFQMPRTCPVCGGKVIRRPGEVDYYCADKNCSIRHKRELEHFISKAAFDIIGLGPKILNKLIDVGLISNPADIFQLSAGDLEPLERFAEKSAQNVIDSIKSKKEITLSRLIYSLGIRHVGEETANDLAKRFGSIEKIQNLNIDQLNEIEDIGPVVAKSIYDWFNDKTNQKILSNLLKEIKIINPEISNKLNDKEIVFTGTLKDMSREQARKLVRDNGGKAPSSLTNDTDYLVVGEGGGSKREKAEKMGIKIISEKEFKNLIK